MSDDETLRLFIELTLPPEIVEALGRIQRVCRTRLPEGSIRWVAPEGIHLTLRFLGETAGSRQTDAEAAVKAAVRAAPGPQRLELSGYGSFPSGRTAPRVLFVGLRDVGGGLPALTAALDKALARVGWAPEGRPFRPHLTLGRVREDLRTTRSRRSGARWRRFLKSSRWPGTRKRSPWCAARWARGDPAIPGSSRRRYNPPIRL